MGSSESRAPVGASPSDREPDYRFTLANERTFLAWIRTSLALLAGGVAVGQLFYGAAPDLVGHRTLGIACVALATVLSVASYVRWRQVQRAMRQDGPLPNSPLIWIIVVGMCVLAVVCTVMILR